MNNTDLLIDNSPATVASPFGEIGPKSTGKTILIVDDDSDTLRLLEFLMSSEGYVVQTADGAESAMALLYSFTPDALLLDIRLPGMNGLQLTRLMKLTGKTQKVPILAVSSRDTALAIQEAYDAGFDGYITKPVDTNTFASTVGQYLDRH
jgi:CheY-like chemotaxis protein